MSKTRADTACCPIVDVMGFPLWAVDSDGLIRLMLDRATAGVRCRVGYVNAHVWNLARRDPAFREVLLGTDILYADGMSFIWAGRLLGVPLPARLSAADYIVDFARGCRSRGLSVYLLGGRVGVADRAGERLCRLVPGLKVVGTADGHFDLSEGPAVIDRINRLRPDVLLVGMGSPRQETWAASNRDALTPPVVWMVGALFDYLAGAESRAPGWMCRMGLEWLFRLAMDPRGKASRYLWGNPAFAGSVIGCCLRRAIRRGEPSKAGAV